MIYFILFFHWLTDFVLQTDKMALNKSKSLKWLGLHSITYGLPWIIFGWKISLFLTCSHFVIDFVTSRITSYLWQKGDRHNFFVIIGLDQFIHITSIIWIFRVFGIPL